MKIIKSFIAFIGMLGLAFGGAACSNDWGEADPEAGNQTYPSREIVGTYTFDYEEGAAYNDIYLRAGNTVEAVADDSIGNDVLRVDSGYAVLANPLNSVKLQNGAAVTFWVKVSEEDLDTPILSFSYNEADSAVFSITPYGQIAYTKPGQLESLNFTNDQTYQTGTVITPNKWQFYALQIRDNGYDLFVDGVRVMHDTYTGPKYATDFDMNTLVEFLNNAPYIILGNADTPVSNLYLDKLTIIRNQMIARDYAYSGIGGGGNNNTEKVYVTVGLEDNSSGWWSEFSDYFTIPADQSFHTVFINHTNGVNNWNNWVLACTTADVRGGANYAEYFVLRADNFGWGDGNYNAANLSCDYNWDTFIADMTDATVDLTVQRSGSTVTITAITTTTAGTVYTYTYTQDTGNATEDMNVFFVCEGCHLDLDPAETVIGATYEPGSKLVGNADFTSGWWTAFSDSYTFNGDMEHPLVFHFINNQTGTGSNWNNWLLVCTDGGYSASCPAPYTGTGAEYFVLRSDAFGWGSDFDASSVITSSFEWTTYVADMHGAECWVKVNRSGSDVTMEAKQKKAEDGIFMPDYSFTYNAINTANVGFFLTAELASLDLLHVGYYPYYDKVFETK